MAQKRQRLLIGYGFGVGLTDFLRSGQEDDHHHHRRQQAIDDSDLHKTLLHVAVTKIACQLEHARCSHYAAGHGRHHPDTCHGAAFLTVVG